MVKPRYRFTWEHRRCTRTRKPLARESPKTGGNYRIFRILAAGLRAHGFDAPTRVQDAPDNSLARADTYVDSPSEGIRRGASFLGKKYYSSNY